MNIISNLLDLYLSYQENKTLNWFSTELAYLDIVKGFQNLVLFATVVI